jgi:hypothetical protein
MILAPKPKRSINYADKLDRIFSHYIKLKESLLSTGMITECVCITCGRRKPISQIDAGHYMSRRFWATRWDERNVHAQCHGCNRLGRRGRAGDHNIYKLRLIQLYDEQTVQEIQIAAQRLTYQFRDSQLIESIKHYQREIEKIRGKLFQQNK